MVFQFKFKVIFELFNFRFLLLSNPLYYLVLDLGHCCQKAVLHCHFHYRKPVCSVLWGSGGLTKSYTIDIKTQIVVVSSKRNTRHPADELLWPDLFPQILFGSCTLKLIVNKRHKTRGVRATLGRWKKFPKMIILRSTLAIENLLTKGHLDFT